MYYGQDNNITEFGPGQGQDQFSSNDNSVPGGYGQDSSNTGSDTNGSKTSGRAGYGQDSNTTSGGHGQTESTDRSYGSSDQGTQGATYGSGSDPSQSDEYGSHSKPGMGDRLKGSAEKFAGKVTGNTGLEQKGQERKAGDYVPRSTY